MELLRTKIIRHNHVLGLIIINQTFGVDKMSKNLIIKTYFKKNIILRSSYNKIFKSFRSVKIKGDYVVSAGNLICVYSIKKQVTLEYL